MPEQSNSSIKSLAGSHTAILSLIFLLIIASYINTLHSPTVLDDQSAFIESSRMYLPDISLKSIYSLTKTQFGLSRFLPILTFALNHYFSGGRIIDYHLTNIAIHLVTTIFFYLFLNEILLYHRRRNNDSDMTAIFPRPLFMAAAVGLWALNPVQTNAVTYLVQRMASMCAMFYLASLFFYVKGRQHDEWRKAALFFTLSAIAAGSAFLSKENSATLPIAILMVETYFISPGIAGRLIKKIKLHHWFLLATAIAIFFPVITTIISKMTAGYSLRPFTMTERLMTEARVVVWYITLLLLPLPSRMNFDYDFPISHSLIDPPTTILSIILILTIIAAAITASKKHPLLSFGILWFFINLVIESTIIPLEIIFEHRLYLPSMGIFIAIASLYETSMTQLIHTHKNNIQIAFLSITILISISSILTTTRNATWMDIFRLYNDCYQKAPNKPRNISNLAIAYAKNGNFDESNRLFKEAISKGRKFDEEYISSANNIVINLAKQHKTKEALSEGTELYQNIPTEANLVAYSTFLYNLAIMCIENNKLVLGFEYLKESLLFRRDKSIAIYTYPTIRKILTQIYNSPNLRKKVFPQSSGDKTTSIAKKLFQIALDVRDYRTAERIIKDTENIDIELAVNLKYMLKNVIDKNKTAIYATDVTRHHRYQNSIIYKISYDTILFINKYYHPLKPVATRILKWANNRYPKDVFLKIISFRKEMKAKAKDKKFIKEVESYYNEYDHNPQIISLIARIYMENGEFKKAENAISRLFYIYPNIDRGTYLYWGKLKRLIQSGKISPPKKTRGGQVAHLNHLSRS